MTARLRVETYPDRESWLAARHDPTTIGASEAPAALGVSPFQTPWDVWERKTQPALREEPTEAMARGIRWEPMVLQEYQAESGHRVLSPSEACGTSDRFVVLAHPEHPWLRQTPDAFATEDGVLGQVEAKTSTQTDAWTDQRGVVVERWSDACASLLPPHIAVQAYVQLSTTDLPWNDVVALLPIRGWLAVRWVRLMRDEDTQGQIVDALASWRERHLVHGEAPEVDGSDACTRHLARTFARVEKLSREATAEEVHLMRELEKARRDRDAADAFVRETSNRLVAQASGARLTFPGSPKSAPYGQPQAAGGGEGIDLDRLRHEFPDVARACTVQRPASVSFRTYRLEKE